MQATIADATLFGQHADFWEALGVWFSGAITVGLLWYANLQLKDAKVARGEHAAAATELIDEQTRPYVVVDFHFRSILISISVKNIGQTPATNVRVLLNDPVASAVMPEVRWQTSGLFSDGVAFFAPAREMRFVLDAFPARVEAGLPTVITGTVEYGRMNRSGERFIEPFVIDLSGYSNALLPPRDISDVADEIKQLRTIVSENLGRT